MLGLRRRTESEGKGGGAADSREWGAIGGIGRGWERTRIAGSAVARIYG